MNIVIIIVVIIHWFQGSGLAPGCYKYISPTQQLLTKTVSKRGPYDLYTGDRIPESKAQLTNPHLAPGHYEIKPFTYHIQGKPVSSHISFRYLIQLCSLNISYKLIIDTALCKHNKYTDFFQCFFGRSSSQEAWPV